MDTPTSICPAFRPADRQRLLQALAQTHDAKLSRRLRAVAEVAQGQPITVIARRARVARSTLHRWIKRYRAEQGPEALAERQRSGRPRVALALTDDRLHQLLTSDPRQFGYTTTTWTVPLLAAHLRAQGVAISPRTLRRRLRAARFRWKRPRYVDSQRAAHVAAKKGGLCDG
jgi:transposase